MRLPAGRYYAITDAAVAQRRLTTSWTLREPAPCLAVRSDVALEDRTAYEMLTILELDGWTWQDTTTFKRLTGHDPPIGYKPGDEKLFFSSGAKSGVISDLYMKALHLAEDSCSCKLATQSPTQYASRSPPCLKYFFEVWISCGAIIWKGFQFLVAF